MNTTMKASKVTGRVCRPASGVAERPQRRHCLGGSLYPGEKTSSCMCVCALQPDPTSPDTIWWSHSQQHPAAPTQALSTAPHL